MRELLNNSEQKEVNVMMKTWYMFRIRSHVKAGTDCQTVRTENERDKLRLEQRGYTCYKTPADFGGLVERWQCCLNE